MVTVGLVCEYNPFHNGHLYQIEEIKRMYPDSIIIAVMGTNFLQRGEISLINKWDKTSIALEYGIDLVIELPFVFSSQSADIFAKGAINILNYLNVDKLVFGSETNDVDLLNKLADIQLNNKDYDIKVKQYLDEGINYPTALAKALNSISKISISKPNDLLGLSYIKELKKLNSTIEPVSIKRTSDYHSIDLNSNIVSATSVREAIMNNQDIKRYVPNATYMYLKSRALHFIENYYPFLKYKIMTTPDLSIYQTVDEGIENRIKKYINQSTSLDELINNVKTKRYTYNKLKRMFAHILCGFTKEEANDLKIEYIRVLGFNNKGQKYLNCIKKKVEIPIITGYSNIDSKILDIEYRVNCVYASVLNEKDKIDEIEREKNRPIKK